jgi:leader peptidase (prepilin peptidase)/N-methyltransferase
MAWQELATANFSVLIMGPAKTAWRRSVAVSTDLEHSAAHRTSRASGASRSRLAPAPKRNPLHIGHVPGRYRWKGQPPSSMHVLVVAFSAAAAAAMGWYCRASSRIANWVGAAGGPGQLQGGLSSRARWAMAAALPTGAVVATMPARGPRALPPLIMASLAVWAVALAILALIDQQSLVIPTKLVRGAALMATAFLVAGSCGTGDGRYLWKGVACAGGVGLAFGAWAAVKPRELGFGDARMASLVALGAGALSVSGSLAALSCSPLIAGLVGKHRARSHPGPATAAVALGPFLAAGGLLVVIVHAF